MVIRWPPWLACALVLCAGCTAPAVGDAESKSHDPSPVIVSPVDPGADSTNAGLAPPARQLLTCVAPCGAPTGAQGAEPWLAVSPHDPLHAVALAMAQSKGDLSHPWAVVSVTRDGAQTWDHAMPPGALADGGRYAFFADPMVAFTPDGTVVLAGLVSEGPSWLCTAVACNGPPVYARPLDLVTWRSTDGGATWEEPVVVAESLVGTVTANVQGAGGQRLAATPYHDREQIASDPVTGDVHLLWSELRNDGRSVLWSVSHDGGVTWSPPVAIDDTLYGASAAARDGKIVATFKRTEGTDSTFAVTQSGDAGAHWSPPHVLGDMPSPNWQPAPPAIFPDGTVWIARPVGDREVVVERWDGNQTPVWNWTGQATAKRDIGFALDETGRGILAFYDGSENHFLVAPVTPEGVGEPVRIGNTTTDDWQVFEYLGTGCSAGTCYATWPAMGPEYGLWSVRLDWAPQVLA